MNQRRELNCRATKRRELHGFVVVDGAARRPRGDVARGLTGDERRHDATRTEAPASGELQSNDGGLNDGSPHDRTTGERPRDIRPRDRGCIRDDRICEPTGRRGQHAIGGLAREHHGETMRG